MTRCAREIERHLARFELLLRGLLRGIIGIPLLVTGEQRIEPRVLVRADRGDVRRAQYARIERPQVHPLQHRRRPERFFAQHLLRRILQARRQGRVDLDDGFARAHIVEAAQRGEPLGPLRLVLLRAHRVGNNRQDLGGAGGRGEVHKVLHFGLTELAGLQRVDRFGHRLRLPEPRGQTHQRRRVRPVLPQTGNRFLELTRHGVDPRTGQTLGHAAEQQSRRRIPRRGLEQLAAHLEIALQVLRRALDDPVGVNTLLEVVILAGALVGGVTHADPLREVGGENLGLPHRGITHEREQLFPAGVRL